jgi:hypothetical protein
MSLSLLRRIHCVFIILTVVAPFWAQAQNKQPLDLAQLNSKQRQDIYPTLIKSQSSLKEHASDQLHHQTNIRLAPSEEELEKYKESFYQKEKALEEMKLKDKEEFTGGIDTGGGTLVKAGSGWFRSFEGLLDFYNFAPNIVPDAYVKSKIHSSLFNCDLYKMESSILDAAIMKHQISEVMYPLTAGRSESLSTFIGNLSLIDNAQSGASFIFSQRSLGPEALDTKAYIRPNHDTLERTSLAIYIQGQGTLISAPDFNRLFGRDQVGLIVHEILREVSIGYELYVSDYDLQKITAELVSKSTKGWFLKDDQEFKATKLPEKVFMGPFTKYAVRSILIDICEYLSVAYPERQPGPECKSLSNVDVDKIYSKVELVHHEVVTIYNNGSEDPHFWLLLIENAEERFQSRADKYSNPYKQVGLARLIGNQYCGEFVQFLRDKKILK